MSDRKEIKAENLKQLKKFCPITRRRCKINCVSFRTSRYWDQKYSNGEVKTHLAAAYCSSPILDHDLLPELSI